MPGPRTHHDTGQTCLCSKFHQPYPLELNKHHILPQENGGPSTPDNFVWLCPTAHVNVHELIALMRKLKVELSWKQVGLMYAAPVSRYAYDVAREGYRRILGLPWSPILHPSWYADSPTPIPGQMKLPE